MCIHYCLPKSFSFCSVFNYSNISRPLSLIIEAVIGSYAKCPPNSCNENLVKHLRWGVLRGELTVFSCKRFSQNTPPEYAARKLLRYGI